MRLRLSILLLLITFGIFLPASTVRADEVLNGTFSENLNKWEVTGDVTVDNRDDNDPVAVLGDNTQLGYSILFQRIGLNPGLYSLSFDFKTSLSGYVPDNSFPDTFFATLYYSSNDSFDPESCSEKSSCDYLSIFSQDYLGRWEIGGIIGPSSISGYSHFSTSFLMTSAFAIPTFELYDLNINNLGVAFVDSLIFIDNVSITEVSAIPEPGTLLSLAIGLIGLGIAGKRNYLAISDANSCAGCLKLGIFATDFRRSARI